MSGTVPHGSRRTSGGDEEEYENEAFEPDDAESTARSTAAAVPTVHHQQPRHHHAPDNDNEHGENDEDDEDDGEEEEAGEGDEEELDDEEDGDDDDDEESDESDDDEDDDDEDEESEEDEEPFVSIKVSREGEGNVKVFVVKRRTPFSTLVDEVQKRFGFELPSCFVLYTIDESGDRVDVDTPAVYKHATARFWKELAARRRRSSPTVSCRFYLREVQDGARPRTAASAPPVVSSPAAQVAKLAADMAFSASSSPLLLARASSPMVPSTVVAAATAATGATTPLAGSFASGKTVTWKKMSMLGKGSFGTVYEGITTDGRFMAVKVQDLPMDESEETPEVKSLMQEINLMKQLNHKNIVQYYGCQTVESECGGKQVEIFLEFCSGGTLTTVRRRYDAAHGRLSMSLARSYTKQVLEGLAYLHQRGVMHRDIKGDNVLITNLGEAKLADFGCSKRIGTATMASGQMQTALGSGGVPEALFQTMVGTPLFMAPEVMNDTGTGYTKSADVWSVGCLVVELLGSRPWLVAGSNLFQVMYQISQSKDLPTGIPSDTPPQLMDFLRQCFERDPAKRATATQLLAHPWLTCDEEDLEDFLPPAPAPPSSPPP